MLWTHKVGIVKLRNKIVVVSYKTKSKTCYSFNIIFSQNVCSILVKEVSKYLKELVKFVSAEGGGVLLVIQI